MPYECTNLAHNSQLDYQGAALESSAVKEFGLSRLPEEHRSVAINFETSCQDCPQHHQLLATGLQQNP